MTISANVRKELFEMTAQEGKLIRIKPTEAKAGTTVYSSKQSQPLKMWTQEEHEKFLEAMEKYPSGPWKVIASFIGTKTTRQTMTHAQKYRQKISRWRRGLRHKGRKQAGVGGQGVANGGYSGDDAQSSEEADYCAKENLFKAIEYVSGDDMSHYSNENSPVRGAGYDGAGEDRSELFKLAELASFEKMKQEPPMSPESRMSVDDVDMGGDQDITHRYELKQRSADMNSTTDHLSHKFQKMDWYSSKPQAMGMNGLGPSKEWCTRKTEIKLSPLRGADGLPRRFSGEGRVLSAITGLSYMNRRPEFGIQNLQNSSPNRYNHGMDTHRASMPSAGAFRLPPLNMTTTTPAPPVPQLSGTNGFSIPPLRSKIDPSVFNRAQFTSTN